MADPIVAVVAAAGAGTRLGADIPKQYLELDGKAVLQRSIDALLAVPQVQRAVVVLAKNDTDFVRLPAAKDARVQTVVGGGTRAASVLAGINAVRSQDGDDAWALVHDAARPLVAAEDVNALITVACTQDTGAILAVPVADTLKRADDDNSITETVARDQLWCAQTPQMFRAGALGQALHQGLAGAGASTITDEASAMEQAGHRCLLVKAVHPNLKITHAGDLALAHALLHIPRHTQSQDTVDAHR